MKCVIVGNIPLRTEVFPHGKISKPIMSGSYVSALTAAKLGCETTLISRISSNFPEKFIREIKKNKINLIKLPAWSDTKYEVNYKKGYDEGKKEVIIKSDAGPILNTPEIDADVVIINSYFGQIGLNVFKTLKKPNNLLCLDVQSFLKQKNPNGTIFLQPWLDIDKYQEYIDVLKVNSNELLYLTGNASFNAASNLLKHNTKTVFLVTMDKAYIFWPKGYIKIPKYQVNKQSVVGVGEIYDTALAVRLKETETSEHKYDITDAGFFAEAAASLAREKCYYKTMFTRKKVEKRYKILKNLFLV